MPLTASPASYSLGAHHQDLLSPASRSAVSAGSAVSPDADRSPSSFWCGNCGRHGATSAGTRFCRRSASSCVPGSLYATHVAQPVARLDAVGGVQGAKHAEQAVIITSRSSYMLVFWVILEMLMHIFHAVLSVCFPVPVRFWIVSAEGQNQGFNSERKVGCSSSSLTQIIQREFTSLIIFYPKENI